ncbi:hypothetical protein A5674_17200 [Mycobacterium malmoense]|uniref:PPE family protein n=1 Tax=Mycobacterium malmoense TaxID=1780 RepID=UPI00080B7B64|nr:PPE family protein [Mycobacterium malmoense]OCB28074.1 hypothetical protein A5674_17200 [Mycobacterium malmoense]
MDFGMFPPEFNSGRMYAGPGAAPLSAAAQAWAQLADELYTAAGRFGSVVAELTAGPWSGPTSASMAAAAAPYLEWLGGMAALAEETAARATSAVAAYDAAFAATVPPPIIAANRSLLAALVATNFFGQNTAAIAATEAEYAEMWAQDAAAMYTYAGSSAAATALTPLTSPGQNTDPAGPARQAAAVSQAVSAPAGDALGVVSDVGHTFSAVPTALQSLATAAPAAASDPLSTLADLETIFVSVPASVLTFAAILPLVVIAGPVDLPIAALGTLIGFHTDDIVSGWNGEEVWPGYGPAPVWNFPATLTNLSPGAVPTLSAGLAEAKAVGGLSVPQAWTVAASELRPVALASPLASIDSAMVAPLEVGSSDMLGDMGVAGMTGRAMAGAPSGGGDGAKVTGQRVVARFGGAVPGSDGQAPPVKPRVVVTGVAARIREITRLRDEGHLNTEEYQKLKNELLGR